MPPRIKMPEVSSLSETGSANKMTPPAAAIAGTDSCTSAACIEHTAKGSNPRYVVTNLKGAGAQMENRIKEQQLEPHQLPPLVVQCGIPDHVAHSGC